MEEDKVDYLDVDDHIPGQNFVCLSFVSPEDLIQNKEAFKCAKFLQAYCKDKNLNFDKVYEEYKDFCYKFSDNLQKDFDEQNKFQTNVRGLKVRGVYETRDSAERRAKKLQTIDSDFHVYVAQVGFWLPWNPEPDKIESEAFINSQLNDMMEKYKENSVNKDLFYEKEKREKVTAAREKVLRKKKEEMENKKLEDKEVEPEAEVVNSEVESCVEEIKEVVNQKDKLQEISNEMQQDIEDINVIKEGEKLDSDLQDSLNDEDPWMKNKIK
jgi:chemotaxis protein histidine kinase CheA